MGSFDHFDPIREQDKRYVLEHFSRYKNLSKLDFDIKEFVTKGKEHWSARTSKFEKLKNGTIRVHPPKKDLFAFYGDDYNLSAMLTTSPLLHAHDVYLSYLDQLTGYALKNIPKNQTKEQLKEILRNGLIVNFAETGLLLAFYSFLLKKHISVLELEPSVYKNKLDMKIGINSQEIFIEAFAPVARTTMNPNKISISAMVNHEVKDHLMEKIKQPIILLIMQNIPFWGGNLNNEGKLNNFMFHPLECCIKDRKGRFNHSISAVIRKLGNISFLHLNEDAAFPLSEDLIKKLTNHYYIDRIIPAINYKYTTYILTRRTRRRFEKDPEVMAQAKNKNIDLKKHLDEWTKYLENYPPQ